MTERYTDKENIMALNMIILPRPPYHPDLGPSDYILFRSLQHFSIKK